PSDSPSTPYGLRRASIQATTATCEAGGSGRAPLSKLAAYRPELVTKVSVLLMLPPQTKRIRYRRDRIHSAASLIPTYRTRNTWLADIRPMPNQPPTVRPRTATAM